MQVMKPRRGFIPRERTLRRGAARVCRRSTGCSVRRCDKMRVPRCRRSAAIRERPAHVGEKQTEIRGNPCGHRCPKNATFALRSRTVFRDRVLPAGSVGRRSFGHSTPNGWMCSRWSHPGSEVSEPCAETTQIQLPAGTASHRRGPEVARGRAKTTGNYQPRRRIPAGGARPRGFFRYDRPLKIASSARSTSGSWSGPHRMRAGFCEPRPGSPRHRR